ncbi:MAG: 7-cyano-7-deazaguanine synthase [Candidatus Aenigmatarchaeota archaeon]
MKKAICLISAGIDSPVAATLMSKKYEIILLHFVLYPFYCKGSFNKMIEIMKHLKNKMKYKYLILFPWAEILSKISKAREKDIYRKYMCVLCRRAMFKTAEKIAKKEKIDFIITGESLAQKASQTLQNMIATTSGIKIPILQPLLGLDKIEIEKLSKKLSIWFEKHVGCCELNPDRPITKARPEILDKLYQELDLEKIINKNLKNIQKIKSLEKPEKYFSILLKKL